MFNPEAFLQATFNEANDTQLIPCPVGEFQASIDEIKVRTGTIGKGEKTGEEWAGIDVYWTINDQAAQTLAGREKLRVKQGVFIDLTPNGTIDMSKGKNISLGKLREAVDLNKAGQAFGFNMLTGRHAVVKVAHRADANDATRLYDEVVAVRKVG